MNEMKMMYVAGGGETAHLQYTKNKGYKVNVFTLPSFIELKFIHSNSLVKPSNVKSFDYIVIDTEGHEPFIIHGMKLHHITNQQRFHTFQYEVGQHWIGPQNPLQNYTQLAIAELLYSIGYDLYLIGCDYYWKINAKALNHLSNSL